MTATFVAVSGNEESQFLSPPKSTKRFEFGHRLKPSASAPAAMAASASAGFVIPQILTCTFSILLDHAAAHGLHLLVMCDDAHSSVACTKECTEDPAHDGNEKSADECAAERLHVKTGDESGDDHQHERVDH